MGLRPAWRRAVEAHVARPGDPDATGTRLISLANGEGDSPRDAVSMRPLTIVAGVIEKHAGKEPLDVLEVVPEQAARAPHSRWPTLR